MPASLCIVFLAVALTQGVQLDPVTVGRPAADEPDAALRQVHTQITKQLGAYKTFAGDTACTACLNAAVSTFASPYRQPGSSSATHFWASNRPEGGRRTPTPRFPPDRSHLFLDGEGKSMPAEYERPGHIPAQVLDDIAEWVLAITPRSPR